ncbi:hypothetical protein E2C01_048964 [Portunus trituberculatus]|uniref:Uncharacterized protein n=1 Tax=Portunus trituberculatus TaxID=210409 RepID=A0A5B7GCN0_PORTR|nr:hypothetical protein [Portunus trituberculatus]
MNRRTRVSDRQKYHQRYSFAPLPHREKPPDRAIIKSLIFLKAEKETYLEYRNFSFNYCKNILNFCQFLKSRYALVTPPAIHQTLIDPFTVINIPYIAPSGENRCCISW